MQTTDSGLLFQSTAQIHEAANRQRKRAAADQLGSPIQTGKVLDFIIHADDAYVAESGWQARRISLKTGKTVCVFRGHQGPVTSVSLIDDPVPILITGSWDKSVRIWNTIDGQCLHVLVGHTDFVKSLTLLPSSRFLVSTSSDRTIRLWDLTTLQQGKTPRCVDIINQHTRPVDCAAVAAVPDEENPDAGHRVTFWTGDSMGVLNEWIVYDGRLQLAKTLPGHETSIADLFPVEEGLWSVSMDKTAILHSYGGGTRVVIPHITYVRSVLAIPPEMTPRQLVVTGSDDEVLRVWEISDDNAPLLVSTVDGHCGTVNTIRLWKETANPAFWSIVSGDLDGTIRRWTLKDLLHPAALQMLPVAPDMTMTADEEEELAELLSDPDTN